MRAIAIPAALAGLVLLVGCRPNELAAPTVLGGVPVDEFEYEELAIAGLDEAWTLEEHGSIDGFVAGDFVGDAASEIALMTGDTVLIYDLLGQRRGAFVPADGTVEPAFASDVDQDGKDDLVFGGRRSGSARVVITRGDGTVVRDTAIQAMFEADTHPRFHRDGTIYFHAASRVHVSPKIVGAYDVLADRTEWITNVAGVPTALSLGHDGRLAVSSFAVSRDRDDEQFPLSYAGEHSQTGLVVLDAAGDVARYEAVGPRTVDGEFVEQGVAALDVYVVDGDADDAAGAPTLLTVRQRFSDLFEGPTELTLRDASGDITARFRGDPETKAEIAVFRIGDNPRFLASFDRTGRFVLLDEDLTVLAEFTRSGSLHRAALWEVGDFDGDGDHEFLVSDNRVLMLLSEDLEVEWETVFDGAVSKAAALPDGEGRLALVVAAGDLHLFSQNQEAGGRLALFSEPPGADFYIDGTRVDPGDFPVVGGLMPGPHEVYAEFPGTTGPDGRAISATFAVEVEAGRMTELVARFADLPVTYQPGTPVSACETDPASDFSRLELLVEKQVPSWLISPRVGEFLPDDGAELVFFDRSTSRLQVYDGDLALRRDVRLSGRVGFAMFFTDVDGDGYQDIYASRDGLEKGVWASTLGGRMLFDKPLLYGNDLLVRLLPPAWFADRLYAVLQTGYLEGPDAVVGLDPPMMSTAYLYPIPAQGNSSVPNGDRLYLSMYSVSNGNEFVYPDGTAVNDREVFVNVMTTEGEKHPHARHFDGDPQGGLVFFEFDANGDGETEVYFQRDHDPNYYNGTGGLFRMDPDGRITRLWEARENDSHFVYALQTGAGPRVVVVGRLSDRLTILDGEFNVLVDMPRDGNPYAVPADRDWDGVIDYRAVDGADTVIRNLDGAELARFPAPAGSAARVVEADIDCDGAREFILNYEGIMQIWGHR